MGHAMSTCFGARFLYYVAVPVSFFSALLYLLWMMRAQRTMATTSPTKVR